jgi:hypothetical protein
LAEDVKTLSCAEANGYPEVAQTTCVGEFVRHYWIYKDLLPAAVEASITQYFLPQVHRLFHQISKFGSNITDTTFPNWKKEWW